jgi:hypothetical protein
VSTTKGIAFTFRPIMSPYEGADTPTAVAEIIDQPGAGIYVLASIVAYASDCRTIRQSRQRRTGAVKGEQWLSKFQWSTIWCSETLRT